jgi:hypothetical protein
MVRPSFTADDVCHRTAPQRLQYWGELADAAEVALLGAYLITWKSAAGGTLSKSNVLIPEALPSYYTAL